MLGRKDFGPRYATCASAICDEDTRPGPSEIATTGYTLLDASGGFRVVQALELQVHARNLTNSLYMVSPDARAVPAPGRSVTLSAHVTF